MFVLSQCDGESSGVIYCFERAIDRARVLLKARLHPHVSRALRLRHHTAHLDAKATLAHVHKVDSSSRSSSSSSTSQSSACPFPGPSSPSSARFSAGLTRTPVSIRTLISS